MVNVLLEANSYNKCDGVEATKCIRAIEKESKTNRFTIIALTADIQDSARQTCMNAGMDGFVNSYILNTY